METTSLVNPDTSTGVERFVVVPSPNCPWLFKPQHFTPPEVISAQAYPLPVAIAVTPLVNPDTSTGMRRSVVVPSPNCPQSLSPQHLTPPEVVTAQVSRLPVEIDVTPRPDRVIVTVWALSTSPSSTPVTVTVWAEFQFSVVNVNVAGDTVTSPGSDDDNDTTADVAGCSDNTTSKVSVVPDSSTEVDPPDTVTEMVAAAATVEAATNNEMANSNPAAATRSARPAAPGSRWDPDVTTRRLRRPERINRDGSGRPHALHTSLHRMHNTRRTQPYSTDTQACFHSRNGQDGYLERIHASRFT